MAIEISASQAESITYASGVSINGNGEINRQYGFAPGTLPTWYDEAVFQRHILSAMGVTTSSRDTETPDLSELQVIPLSRLQAEQFTRLLAITKALATVGNGRVVSRDMVAFVTNGYDEGYVFPSTEPLGLVQLKPHNGEYQTFMIASHIKAGRVEIIQSLAAVDRMQGRYPVVATDTHALEIELRSRRDLPHPDRIVASLEGLKPVCGGFPYSEVRTMLVNRRVEFEPENVSYLRGLPKSHSLNMVLRRLDRLQKEANPHGDVTWKTLELAVQAYEREDPASLGAAYAFHQAVIPLLGQRHSYKYNGK